MKNVFKVGLCVIFYGGFLSILIGLWHIHNPSVRYVLSGLYMVFVGAIFISAAIKEENSS